jgi:hypothetical protein
MEQLKRLLETLKARIWGEELYCHDSVFGHLTTQRIKGRGRPVGDPPLFAWFAAPRDEPGLRFATIEQLVFHAGRNGPGSDC